jgi:hypothetical protein
MGESLRIRDDVNEPGVTTVKRSGEFCVWSTFLARNPIRRGVVIASSATRTAPGPADSFQGHRSNCRPVVSRHAWGPVPIDGAG